MVAQMFGPFDREGTGIWVGYESPEENDDKEIGVRCGNCVLYKGDGVCSIIEQQVEEYGKCRFAIIPDGYITEEDDDEEEEDMDEMESQDDSEEIYDLISLIRDLLNNKEK
jgi:hypothetical protein